jgi:hypothetical protein
MLIINGCNYVDFFGIFFPPTTIIIIILILNELIVHFSQNFSSSFSI